MPKSKTLNGTSKALQPDQDAVVPRLKLGEQGFIGLRVSNRHILEDTQRAFRYPAFIKTINEMRNNPTVGAAMNVYRFMMQRVNWSVQAPVGATDVEKERAAVIETMMHDCDHSWANFIETVIPFLEYGFAVNEIVLRRRLKRNGSKFNDGLVGIKKLATRSQDTIFGWRFNPDHSEIVALQQTIRFIENGYLFTDRLNDQGYIEIDRDKFLLFTTDETRGNPEGNSIFKNIYLAYKQLTLLQENQLVGISKDIQGILKISIPPQYLDPNASDADKAAVKGFQAIIDGYNAGTQRGLLVPNLIDPESKQPLFTYDLMETRGTAKYDTESIIKGLQSDILSALNVDILKLGADGAGSFSLASSKTSILALAIDSKLKEIQEVLNQHLMRTLYEANGWGCENLPKFVYEEPEEINLDSLGAFLQRIKAVGLVEVDREILNIVRKAMGAEPKPDDEPVDEEALNIGQSNSKSGDSFSTPTGGLNGTADSVSTKDNSIANKENK